MSEMNSEHEEQTAIFEWAKYMQGKYPQLSFMFSTLNGIRLTIGQAKKAKRAGNKKGISDICFPWNNGKYAGLWIELKASKGRPTKEQKEFIEFMNQQGHYAEVVVGSLKSIELIKKYLNNQL